MRLLTILIFMFSLQLFSLESNTVSIPSQARHDLAQVINKGHAVLDTVIKNLSWTSFSADMQLNLKRNKKDSLIKKMSVKAISNEDGQKILSMFTFPSNMKGMAFLAYCNKNLKDKRYIYLRALRRVKKVPANGDNFMLRDFLSLYLLKPRVELWNYKLISEKDDFAIIEAIAKSKKTINITGYAKLLLTIDKKKNIITKTEFYGKGDKKRRIQTVLDSKIINNIHFITRMETNDLDEGVKAEIILTNIKTEKISKKIFKTRYLKTL